MNKFILSTEDIMLRSLSNEETFKTKDFSIINCYDDHDMLPRNEKVKIIFNGNIYNENKLKEKYRVDDIVSTNKFLLHLYNINGETFLNELEGCFCILIYDEIENTVFGGTDIFGSCAMYYLYNEKCFSVSNLVNMIINYTSYKFKVNNTRVSNFFTFGFMPEDETLFSEIKKVTPGTYFVYKNGKLRFKKYNKLTLIPDDTMTLEIASTKLRSAIKESVFDHVYDSEVGSFLSGGIDSSYLVKETSLIKTLKTFSAGYNENKYNEITSAKEFSNNLGLENYEKIITSEEYFSNTKNIINFLEEPLADASLFSFYFITKYAKEYVDVCLSGEAADEFFGGYHSYQDILKIESYRKKVPRFLRSSLAFLATHLPNFKGRDFLIRASIPLNERFVSCSNRLFSPKELQKLLVHEYLNDDSASIIKKYTNKSDLDEASKMLQVDINLWFINDIMLIGNKFGLANNLDIRMPFLDRRVWEVARRIPSVYKITKETTKLVLREASSDVLDYEMVHKRKKGFPVPIREWIKEEENYKQIYSSFNSDIAKKYFNRDYINNLLVKHKNGRQDNFTKIWSIYVFILWYENFSIEGDTL